MFTADHHRASDDRGAAQDSRRRQPAFATARQAGAVEDDPFAHQVGRLTRLHRQRHQPATVAQVTLRGWLTLRTRYADPFDPALFDRIDAALTRMPPSRDTSADRTASPAA